MLSFLLVGSASRRKTAGQIHSNVFEVPHFVDGIDTIPFADGFRQFGVVTRPGQSSLGLGMVADLGLVEEGPVDVGKDTTPKVAKISVTSIVINQPFFFKIAHKNVNKNRA